MKAKVWSHVLPFGTRCWWAEADLFSGPCSGPPPPLSRWREYFWSWDSAIRWALHPERLHELVRDKCMPLFEVVEDLPGRFRMHIVEAESLAVVQCWCRECLDGKINHILQLPVDTSAEKTITLTTKA